VVLAGCVIVLRVSPRLAVIDSSRTASINRQARCGLRLSGLQLESDHGSEAALLTLRQSMLRV